MHLLIYYSLILTAINYISSSSSFLTVSLLIFFLRHFFHPVLHYHSSLHHLHSTYRVANNKQLSVLKSIRFLRIKKLFSKLFFFDI